MTELFLDIESAPNMEKEEFFAAKREIESGSLTRQSDPARYWKYSVGALNPYEGKAIFIAYRISSIGLKEWEDGFCTVIHTRAISLAIIDIHRHTDNFYRV